MNPAYYQARFRAELPHYGLPESFAIITACNPDGKPSPEKKNAGHTRRLQKELARLAFDHFPVTGYDPGSSHAESGFGVVCDATTGISLGDSFHQEAVFHVHRGEVALIACGTRREKVPLGPWAALADTPGGRPDFHFRGPFSLLDAPATAFLCSTRCPAVKVAEAYDWARIQCNEGATVISGFHTPVEKDILTILARRGARILWVPARDLPKTLPKSLKPAWEEKRLLILSPFPYAKPSRANRNSCSQRNRFVVRYASSQYCPHVAPGCALAADMAALNL